MSIQDVVKRARTEPTYKPPYLQLFTTYVCRVNDAIAWDRSKIEHELGFKIPDELAALWRECAGMVLYEEAIHRQGGLVILSPLEVVAQNCEYWREREEDAKPGDLIFARFWGDLRLALIRSDKRANDYGAIMIVAEMDERADWYTPARSLEEFLLRYMDAHGDDYWDVHYQQILTERAKAQKS
jgi:hypothetical protein